MKKNKFGVSFWRILYQIGIFVVWYVGFISIKDISSNYQGVLALVSSLTWLLSSILFSKIQNVPEEHKNIHIRWRWVGIINLLLAILIFIINKLDSKIEFWAWSANLLLGSLSILTAYTTIIAYLFPKILQEPPSPPNPLDNLSKSTKEVIETGLRWTGYATIIPIFGFFLIGSIGFIIDTIYFRNSGVDFFLITSGLGFLIGFPLGFVAIYRWQKWARESGIPEEELKAAAKLAGLWWPKTKRPE